MKRKILAIAIGDYMEIVSVVLAPGISTIHKMNVNSSLR